MVRASLRLTDFDFRGNFIVRKINQAKKRNLDYFGGTTAKTARRSMRPAPKTHTKTGKRKKLSRYGRYVEIQSGKRKGQKRFQKGLHSPPGQPPFARSDFPNLKWIVYRTELGDDQTTIFTRRTGGSRYLSVRAPILHEEGGSARWVGNRRERKTARSRRNRRIGQTLRFPKRPFIDPAAQKVLKRYPRRWRGAIR